MSKEELLTAYAEGSISRRMFVRRLVASGVAAGTAVSYAQLLAPTEASARGGGNADDHYPLLTMKILTRDVLKVVSSKRLNVKVTVSESAFLQVAAFVKTQGDLAYAGSVSTGLIHRGSPQILHIPISVKDVQGHRSREVYVNASVRRSDHPYLSTVASAKATLK
jgi:hypothetical protein